MKSGDVAANEPSHTLTVDAPFTGATWARIWSWESLRYSGSGWWLDRCLPRSPLGLVIVAFTIPLAWFIAGYANADDRDAFLGTNDVLGQLWFFPLHVLTLRMTGRLWAAGLAPACDGLALDAAAQARIRRGALGTGASLGAIAVCAYFIVRDVAFGFTPNAAGLIPFDDPALWNMAALGRPVHVMMLVLWCVEWLMFGYLLWLQAWILVRWLRELRAAKFGPRLAEVLVGDGYRNAFTLFSKTTTLALVFAIGNLGFIAYTGELIPRESIAIETAGDFMRQMSDLLSTTLLFVLTLVAVAAFVRVLRASLTRAVNEQYAKHGDATLLELANEVPATGDLSNDVELLRARANAQAGLLRAVVFQREVDVVGGRTMAAMIAKAAVPLFTTALKLRKVLGL